jgi:hypothetical protein
LRVYNHQIQLEAFAAPRWQWPENGNHEDHIVQPSFACLRIGSPVRLSIYIGWFKAGPPNSAVLLIEKTNNISSSIAEQRIWTTLLRHSLEHYRFHHFFYHLKGMSYANRQIIKELYL